MTTSKPQALRDQALEEHYQALFATFGSTGWKHFVEDAQKFRAAVDTLQGLDPQHAAYTLGFRRGQLDVLDWLLAQEHISNKAYDQLLQDEQEGA